MATGISPEHIVYVAKEGPDWFLLGVLFFSALVALFSVATQRVIAKKRAAYDYMVRVRGDANYIHEQSIFTELTENGLLLNVLDGATGRMREEKQAVRNYLNYFELLCVSIEMNILDENVCKAFLGDILVKRWEDAEPLITKVREKDSDSEIFEYFERVARRWEARPGVEKNNFVARVLREIVSI